MTNEEIRRRLADPNCDVKWRQRYMQRARARQRAKWSEKELIKRSGGSPAPYEIPEVSFIGDAQKSAGRIARNFLIGLATGK